MADETNLGGVTLQSVLDKYNKAPESLDDNESIILLTYIMGLQSDQIKHMQSNMKLYDQTITELQHAVSQLQIKHAALERGETESGIIIQS